MFPREQTCSLQTLTQATDRKPRGSHCEHDTVVLLSSETAVVWRPDDPTARPPAASALSGPPHVGDLHDGGSPQLPIDRLPIDRAAKADFLSVFAA